MARGSVLGLWLLIVLVAVVATAVLSLNTTAVLLTPVVLALARQLDLDRALFTNTAVWLANTASHFLPVFNLTNLLAAGVLAGDHDVRFAAVMWRPATVSVLVTVAVLAPDLPPLPARRYRRPPAEPIPHRGLLVTAMIVCGALGPAFLLGVNVLLASAVAAAIVVVASVCRAWRPARPPWSSGRRSPLCGWCTAEAGSFDTVRTAQPLDPTGRIFDMPAFLDKLKAKPWGAHLIRAAERYTNRLGSQFAAAVTYFSVLAMVPLLLLAFSILGFVLTVLYPEVIDEVTVAVTDALGGVDPETQANLSALVTEYLQNWRGVGIVALVAALYSGAGWMGNLKNAVRAQWRPDFDLQEAQGNIVKKTVINLLLLLGLIVLIVITFALASVSTTLTGTVIDALGLSHIGWLRPVLRFVPIIFSIGAGWLLFMYLFSVLPEHREPWPIVRRGALMGAVGLAVLQYAAGLLIAAFQNNKAAQLFGPVIVLMLFLNIFAQLILFIAAWIATARHEAISAPEEKVRFALTPEAEREADSGTGTEPGTGSERGEPVMVPQKIAARSVQVGLGAGYVTGAATGVGLGATLAWLVSKAVRGHRGS